MRIPNVLARLGQIAGAQADLERAVACCRESIVGTRVLSQPDVLAGCLVVLAQVARRRSHFSLAARLLGAASAGRERTGMPRNWDGAAAGREAALLRTELPEDTFAAAWAAGRSGALEAAIAEFFSTAADAELPGGGQPCISPAL